MLKQFVLHCPAHVIIVAFEGQAYFGKHICVEQCLPFSLVVEVGGKIGIGKKQPVAAVCTNRIPFCHK